MIAPNPGPFTYTGSGTYLLCGDQETVVIDPGPADDQHAARIADAAPQPIKRILVTHTHRDHCGGVDELKRLTGAAAFAFGAHPSAQGKASPALDEGADFGFVPDHLLGDEDSLALEGLTIEAVHTPGHIGNHLCFALEEEQALFTGDHIMGWATTVVAPPDGDMAQYMESLEKLLSRKDRIYYPTHGAPIEDPLPFVRAVKAHRLGRDRAILETLSNRGLSPLEIVEKVYVGLADNLKFAAALNVQAHLQAHVRAGRVVEENGSFRIAKD